MNICFCVLHAAVDSIDFHYPKFSCLSQFRIMSVLKVFKQLLTVSCLDYSSTMKMGQYVPPKREKTSAGLYGVTSQNVTVLRSLFCPLYLAFFFVFTVTTFSALFRLSNATCRCDDHNKWPLEMEMLYFDCR